MLGVSAHNDPRDAVSLSEANAVAIRLGGLLDFPEHPYKGDSQADDDA
jgi:hypothetical protein